MRNIVLALVLLVGALIMPASVGAVEVDYTGALWGTVTDANTGHGVGDICVWVTQDGVETHHHGYTNDNGVYEISGMAPGSYDLEFTDCELSRYDATDAVGNVTAGVATQVDATLSLAYQMGGIIGTVTDSATGSPLVELCVKLYQATDDILVTHDYTNADGVYQLVAPAGEYRVRFKPCTGTEYFEQWFDGAEGWDGSTVVTVTAGTYADGVDGALTPNPEAESVVWGEVIDGATGDGVHGYCVSLYEGETKVKTVLTGPEGGWEMVVNPGEYRVKAWACEGHEDLGTVWYVDGAELASADVVGVPSGVEMPLDAMVIGDVRFRDVLESQYHVDIVWLAKQRITLGCNGDGTEFCPDERVTRAHMAAFLHRALGELLAEKYPEKDFDDVVDGSTFDADIRWLAAVGITLGCNQDGTDFCPEEEVTRAQMAAFLHRALEDILAAGEVNDFVDDDGSIFEADIEWLASVGVTGGCNTEGTEFCPDKPVIRSHMAAFLHRALGTA